MVINNILKAIACLQVIFLFANPVTYDDEIKVINGHSQHIHTLTIDMNSDTVELSNALSYDMFYGFEKTSEIVKNNQGYAGVNGMFYSEYGYPLGIIIKDGQVISVNDNGKPLVVIDYNGKVMIGDYSVKVVLIINDQEYEIGVNEPLYEKQYVLYDENYGTTTRIRRESVNYHINNNVVTDITITDRPVSLADDEYVLSVLKNSQTLTIEKGTSITVQYRYSNGLSNIKEGFQTGGWLVKDYENICYDYESYIGNTNIPNPRTVIGVDDKNRMIIKVIDGRSNESYGVTGKESAELMVEAGCANAVFLDGGASGTMVVENRVVNSPSNGEERAVAHGIVVKRYFKFYLQAID